MEFYYLQHELHTDAVLDQPHDQVSLTLEHPVVFPGQCVWVFDREMQVWGRAETKHTYFIFHTLPRSGWVEPLTAAAPTNSRQSNLYIMDIKSLHTFKRQVFVMCEEINTM